MDARKCRCGEPLITYDEQKLGSCWVCAGMSWRLEVLDVELAKLDRAARRFWESPSRPAYAGSG